MEENQTNGGTEENQLQNAENQAPESTQAPESAEANGEGSQG